MSRFTKTHEGLVVSANLSLSLSPYDWGKGLERGLKPLFKDKKGLGMLVKEVVVVEISWLRGFNRNNFMFKEKRNRKQLCREAAL